MTETCKFIRECGAFMLLTKSGDRPAGRPFGAITEIGGALYFATGTGKFVYDQLKKNGEVQIVALKAGTHDWIRVDGYAEERFEKWKKAQMLADCPNLLKHYASAEDEAFHIFGVEVEKSVLYTENGIWELK